MSRYTIIYEKVNDTEFQHDLYYAHIPALDLVTHGVGIQGAKDAAYDLIRLWLEEKKVNHEPVKHEIESFISTIEIEDAIYS